MEYENLDMTTHARSPGFFPALPSFFLFLRSVASSMKARSDYEAWLGRHPEQREALRYTDGGKPLPVEEVEAVGHDDGYDP